MSDLKKQQNSNENEDEHISEESVETVETVADSSDGAVAAPPSERGTKIIKEILEYIEIFVFAVCAVILLFSFMFRICTVKGDSMKNTLLNTENLIISDFLYSPERGDIIVFHQTKTLNEPIVKRVIATEGETVRITYDDKTMTITITDAQGNSTVLEESYMKYDGYPLYRSPQTITVPEDCLFVMGDNRNFSKDSRHPDIGFVDERRVLGKVLFRISPFDRMGTVE